MDSNELLNQKVTQMVQWVYESYGKAKPFTIGLPDKVARHPEWTRRILDAVGSPDKRAYNVAVTGSKGKGSHAILLAHMLQAMGFRVGLFTSPHLVDFLERFRVNGEQIGREDFLRVAMRIRKVTEGFDLPAGQYFGPVGLVAAMASVWFADMNTDVNIFELGRGALHDDVNQICHQGAIVTPVFLEHVFHLGPSLEDICCEKSGIVTTDTRWVVSSQQGTEMREALQRMANEVHCRVIPFDGTALLHQGKKETGATLVVQNRETTPATYTTIHIGDNLLPVADNLVTAWEAAKQVVADIRVMMNPISHLHLERAWLPGRMDVIHEQPLTLLDGTVHRDGASRVKIWMEEQICNGRCTRFGAVLCLPVDKDGVGVIDVLADKLEFIVFCRARNAHLGFDDRFQRDAMNRGIPVYEAVDSAAAKELTDALTRQGMADALIFLGTQSFVGDVLQDFKVNMHNLQLKK